MIPLRCYIIALEANWNGLRKNNEEDNDNDVFAKEKKALKKI